MFDYFTTLSDSLENLGNQFPKKQALIYQNKEYTYGNILRYRNQLAAYFLSCELKKGDRILITLGNTPFSIISFWSALHIGCIPIIIHPKTSVEAMSYILNDAVPRLIICNCRDTFETKILSLVLLDEDIDVLFSQRFFEDYYEKKLPTILDIDLACIIYTSGSTGEAKGVMLSHRNMLSAVASIICYLGYHDSDRILCALPISFDYGLYQMIMAFSVGATLLLEKDFHFPLNVLKNALLHKASIFPLVPSMASIVYEHHKRFRLDFTSIRCVTNTGAALSKMHIDALKIIFPNATLFSMYGLTECKRCTYLPPEKLLDKPGSVGIAIPNSELWIIDEKGFIVPPNTIGQIVIRGAAVMQGYWNKPNKTAEKLKDNLSLNKVLYTGDYGWLDEEGYLYLHGRLDEMLKSRGVKVSPFEIESLLLKMPGIKEAAVIGKEKCDFDTRISAFLVIDKTISMAQIKAYCHHYLPAEKRPHDFYFRGQLPKTLNGKVDKIFLRGELANA